MEERPTLSVISPILIGRENDLSVLCQTIMETKDGQRRVVLVSGEAGVGKSRLVTEATLFAKGQGFLYLQGNCFQTDSVLPYAPFLDVLRSYMTSFPPEHIAAEWLHLAPELVRLLPEVAWLTPDFASVTPLVVRDSQQEKQHLFAAITNFFTVLTKHQPVLFVVEDLHWSDDISLEYLHHLVRQCVSLPLFFIITYRNDEVSASLRHFLSEFDRAHLAREITLNRLSRGEVDAMLQTIFTLHSSIHTGLLDSIYMLTDGNPFFIEEILKSLLATGEISAKDGVWERTLLLGTHRHQPPIPRSIQDAVYQRTQHLTPLAMQLLMLAAVAGRRFDISLLRDIMSIEEPQMVPLIKELIEAQLVVEEAEDRFSFRHALTRQAIYNRLLIRERKKLHRTLAETIEQLNPSISSLEAHLVDLAYHFYEGEEWSKALEYGQRAGERSLALYAPRAAVEHFTHALRAQAQLSETPSTQLYRARGQAYETLGEFERARSDYEQALSIARQVREKTLEWQGLLDLGFLWAGRDYAQSGPWFRQALDLARQSSDMRLHAHSLNRMGNWLVNTGQAEQGLQFHREALTMFEQLQDTRGRAETLDLLGMATGIYGDTISAVENHWQAIQLIRALKDNQQLVLCLASWIAYSGPSMVETTYSVCEPLENCERAATEALQMARQTDTLPGQAYVEWITGAILASYGELGTGLRHGQECLRIATEINHAQWIAGAYFTLGRIYLLLLEPALAMETLSKGLTLSSEIGSAWWTGNITAYFAMACILKGVLLRAEAALKAVISYEQTPRNSPERRMLWAWGELALARDEPDLALNIAERLLSSAPGHTNDQPIPWLLQLKAKALMASGRMSEVIPVLESAKSGLLQRQERPLLWQVHGLLGRAYKYVKQEEQARGEFVAAVKVIEELKETIDDEYLRGNFSRMALKTLPREKYLVASSTIIEKYHGLTEREYTVAMLVAEGKSNREIASTLIVGERTVETHVSNILSKLAFTSRKQIVAWYLQH